MGRLSEYINGFKGSRPSYGGTRSTGTRSTGSSGTVEVAGAEQVEALLDSIMTTDPSMSRLVRKLIAVATRDARNRVSRDISSYLQPNDPRKAAKAVKHMVYKRLFGSNISILAKRKASATRATLKRHRKLDENPRQRGGNRRQRSDRTNQLDSYYGSDRGFVLRFLSSGTVSRLTRYGNRGAIAMSGMFGHIAPWHMQQAIEEISNAITEYIDGKK